MSIGDFAAKFIIGVLVTVVGGVFLAQAVGVPRSNVSVTLDWLRIFNHHPVANSDLKKLLDLANISSNSNAAPISIISEFTLAQLTLENTSTVTATDTNIYARRTLFVLDSLASRRIYRPDDNGPIPVGDLLPGDTRTVYLLIDSMYFFEANKHIRVVSDGTAIPISNAKMMEFPLPWAPFIIGNLNNSIAAQFLAIFAFFADGRQRRSVIQDAKYLREHYPSEWAAKDAKLKLTEAQSTPTTQVQNESSTMNLAPAPPTPPDKSESSTSRPTPA